MALTTTLPMTQSWGGIGVALVNSTGFIAANGGTAPTSTVLLYTFTTNGSVIRSLMAASDDSSPRAISLYISPDGGTTKYLLCTINIPTGSGLTSGTTVNVDLLNGVVLVGLPTDQGGNHCIGLPSGYSIYVGVTIAAVTSGRTIHITGIAENL